ncbi:MAG TPA: transglutaminase-like domain-containing protein [Anaerolineae bacterium]|nr:transglutaminase-like domain-containing protein [Anaerolineae bacterium]
MTSHAKLNSILGVTFVLWLVSMGFIIYTHYIKKVEQELRQFSSDVTFDSENRQYYSIRKDNQKIGYRSEAQLFYPHIMVFMGESVVKMNLAGMSREVFFRCTVGIDSTNFMTKYMEFTLQSGNHTYFCSGTVKDDSLMIEVKINPQAPFRKGFFIVDKTITFPDALPYYIHRSKSDSLNIVVFDPFVFSYYNVHIVRRGSEIQKINNLRHEVVKYDMEFLDKHSTIWLDENGKVVKSLGYLFFSGVLGELSIEKAINQDVFLLPLEVTLGNDLIKNAAFYPDTSLPNPRSTQFLAVELDGIRAANIDVNASNKDILSLNPVIFGIYNKPVVQGQRLVDEMRITANDTSVVGISDYIQSKDARIVRNARTIIGSETDTLKIARLINTWVFTRVKKESRLDIIRSVDILREIRGDSDEHTKLFTALTRSIGIPTQINIGLVYKEGAFRYHSWPSVFVGGVWHDVDPTLGQDAADATHIALVRGDFERVVELLRVLGKMSIKIIEYR